MKPTEPTAPASPETNPEAPAAPQAALPFNLDATFPAPPSPPPSKGPEKAIPKGKPGRPKKNAPAPAKSAPETLPQWNPPGASEGPKEGEQAEAPGPAVVEASALDKNAFRCARATVTLYCIINLIWLGESFEISDKEKSDLTEASQDFFQSHPGITLMPFFALFLEFAAHFARLLQKPAVRVRFFALMRWIKGEKTTSPTPTNAP